MNLETAELEHGITKVILSGRMDIEGATAVDLKFSVIAGAKKKIAVDLAQVSFMASFGVRTLMLSAKATVGKGGKMVLVNPQPNVEKVLETTGASAVIPVVRTIDEAVALLRS